MKALCISWEHRCPRQQLKKDTTTGPNINRMIVMVAAHNQFRTSVVATDYIRRIHSPGWHVKNLRSAKITNLECQLHRIGGATWESLWSLEKNIFRLEIPVAHTILVHALKAVEKLPHIILDVVHRDGRLWLRSFFQLVFQTHVTVLHNGVLNQPSLRICGVKKVKHLNDVWDTFEFTQHLVLSADYIADFLSALECYSLVVVLVNRLEHVA